MRSAALLTALGAVFLVGCGPEFGASGTRALIAPTEHAPSATAVLKGRDGTSVHGEIHFVETARGVRIEARILGFEKPGAHGFHIHEVGDCSAVDFTSAGGHFNPAGATHGGPGSSVRHAGDLGNVAADEKGEVRTVLESSDLRLDGAASVVGRAVIVHEGADDLTTQPTGNAGGRLACGIVELDR